MAERYFRGEIIPLDNKNKQVVYDRENDLDPPEIIELQQPPLQQVRARTRRQNIPDTYPQRIINYISDIATNERQTQAFHEAAFGGVNPDRIKIKAGFKRYDQIILMYNYLKEYIPFRTMISV